MFLARGFLDCEDSYQSDFGTLKSIEITNIIKQNLKKNFDNTFTNTSENQFVFVNHYFEK